MTPSPSASRVGRRALTLGFALSIAYAVPPAWATDAPSTLPQVAPVAGPSCKPWQAPATVPAGKPLPPRVFPTSTAPTTAPKSSPSAPPSTKAVPPAAHRSATHTTVKPGGTPAPTKERVVCLSVAPTPFAQPSWDPATVVGGPELAATGVVTDRPVAVPAPPAVYDVSYVIADLKTGEILAAKSPHAWLRPASTLKALTALTLMPRLDPKRVVVAGQDAQAAAGSRVGVLAGNRYPVASLFDAMLMFSANDAVYALADAAGGYAKTVSLMNQEAAHVGAHDTVTVDPSGLDEGSQRSSAYDLALIGRDAMRLPAFRATIVKRDAVFPGGKDKKGKAWPAFHILNINELLTHYPGAIGIKPGRTDRAQHTFIGAATRGGRTLVVSEMGSITGSWKPTAALLDWGFSYAARVQPVGRLVEPGEAPAPTAAAPASTEESDGVGSGPAALAQQPGMARPPRSGLAAELARYGVTPSLLAPAAGVSAAVVGVLLLAVRRRRRRRA